MANEVLWRAVVERDARYDGRLVYAVTTTGIYCRPSCASRKPRRSNTRFFAFPTLAEAAGFRACRRCDPRSAEPVDPRLELVERVCRYLDAHYHEPLSLATLGERFHVSPGHLRQSFTEVVGISPAAYIDARRMDDLRARLRDGDGIARATYAVGYSSSSQLYERAPEQLGMTPAQYRDRADEQQIRYTTATSPLGWLLVASTERGLCAVRLGDDDRALVAEFEVEFAGAEITRDDGSLMDAVATIVRHLEGREPHLDLPLDVRATAFQRQVWEALRHIPRGETRSYAEVAEAIGRPGATRAVGSACGRNPVALVIPCHRVVRGDGTMGGYRWGIERKRRLLEREQAS